MDTSRVPLVSGSFESRGGCRLTIHGSSMFRAGPVTSSRRSSREDSLDLYDCDLMLDLEAGLLCLLCLREEGLILYHHMDSRDREVGLLDDDKGGHKLRV